MKKSRVSCSMKDKSANMQKTRPETCCAARAQHQSGLPERSRCQSVRRLDKQPKEAGSFNRLQGFIYSPFE